MEATILAANLNRLIGATKAFISQNDRRPKHQYIRIDFCKETQNATAVAIDGYRLAVENATCTVDEDFTVYIKAVLPKATRGGYVAVKLNDNICYLSSGENLTGFRQPGGDFLDYQKTISDITEKPAVYRIGFNGDYLLQALQAAKISCGGFKTPVVLEFREPQIPIVLRTHKDDIKIVLPVRLHD